MKIVFDSNVLISAFATRGLCADLFRETIASHDLLISEYILGEVYGKLTGKLKISPAIAVGIRDLLRQYVAEPGVEPALAVGIRDPDDVPIVSFAMAVSADVLITGDRDLLDVAAESPIEVLSPRQFYER